ncbi:MAG: DUF72 domain-containing protein [Methanobacteriota archaeon]|nr:MAG: DUF72 domain-containing protein [Euryarchaeota archaeon]
MDRSAIKVGICGFAQAQAAVFRSLRLLEVQQTFYKPPRIETAKRWRERAPADFEFTAKAWQLITHEPPSPTYRKAGISIDENRRDRYGSFRPTEEVFAAWEQTRKVCEAMRATFIVFQTPESFGPTAKNKENLYAFFGGITAKGFVPTWEPRGPWPLHVTERICEDLGLQHATDPFAMDLVDQPRAYYRLHGSPPGPKMHAHTYTDEDLRRILGFCDEVDESYVLFDNIAMYGDALRFSAMLAQR